MRCQLTRIFYARGVRECVFCLHSASKLLQKITAWFWFCNCAGCPWFFWHLMSSLRSFVLFWHVWLELPSVAVCHALLQFFMLLQGRYDERWNCGWNILICYILPLPCNSCCCSFRESRKVHQKQTSVFFQNISFKYQAMRKSLMWEQGEWFP